MELAPDLDKFVLFVLLVFPGMVAMRVYRLLMPAREIEWKDSLVEAVFFSTVNFALCLPVLVLIGRAGFSTDHPYWFAFIVMALVLVVPLLVTLSFVKLIRSKLMHGLQVQYPTAWDYFFDKRLPCFVRVHLKEGGYIGGLYSSQSFAAAFPRHGDIYMEVTYRVDKEGTFGAPIEGSKGMLVRAENYTILEFLEITQPDPPQTQGEKHV